MRTLSASQLLEVWERGFGRAPAEQALILLAAACPDLPPDELAAMSIGQRDACLLTLREGLFGSRLDGLVTCPACAERLELDLQTTDLRAGEAERRENGPLSLETTGYDIRFRLPDSTDLIDARGMDTAALRRSILRRCLLSVRRGMLEIPPEELPGEVVSAIAGRMAQADPQAEVLIAVTCPACSHGWKAIFDIAAFVWREITAWSYRILYEVHQLACAYGWREADILALSPWRRKCYLELAGR